MDADLTLTTEILKIVCIFVRSFDLDFKPISSDIKEPKGKMTKLIKGTNDKNFFA